MNTAMTSLPRGTVSFIFTDIEGSTRLWQDHEEVMHRAYLRHDAILEAAIAANHGVRFKTIGDAFQVAFPTARDAVRAACEAQRALATEPWEEPVVIRVRMAIHAGAVDPEVTGDYRSPILNRLGRLLGAGHGGQVILSQTAMELCRDALPPGVSLIDLGEHRLKDLARPERIYQLAGPGLAASFPALKTIDRRPHNLPVQPTPFVGRSSDVEALCSSMRRDSVRLLTITGPGGIGKTRIGLQVGAELLDDYVDGVFLVELAPVMQADLVPHAIASALKVNEIPGEPLMVTLKHRLQDTRTLLLLDNFEHLVAAAPLTTEMLAACPHLKILVTSRLRLRVRGEHTLPLAPLDVPVVRGTETLEELTRHDSMRLFVERAQEVNPGLSLSPEAVQAMAGICAQLDGLPLAIELAASRTRIFPPGAMLARLTSRLPLLTGGPRDAPQRQQTLRNTILWSYDLLNNVEQQLFRHLSMFLGGASLDALTAVTGMDTWDFIDALESLVDHSLVKQVGDGEEPRYLMLETIREFGLEQLSQAGEVDALAERHAQHWATLADQFPDHFGTSEYEKWIARVAIEQDNMRAALRWAFDHDPKVLFRILHAMGGFWQYQGNLGEAISWLVQSKQVITDPVDRARILAHLAMLAQLVGDYDLAESAALEALALFRETNGTVGIVSMLQVAGYAAHLHGDIAQSQDMLGESVAAARELGQVFELCEALNYFGFVLYLQGEYERARPLLEEAVERGRDKMMDEGFSNILHSLGEVCRAMHDVRGAARAYREGLASERRILYHFGTMQLLGGVGILAADQGYAADSVRILAAERVLRSRMQFGLGPDILEDYADARSQAESLLDADAFRAAECEGEGLTFEEAIARANAVVDAILEHQAPG